MGQSQVLYLLEDSIQRAVFYHTTQLYNAHSVYIEEFGINICFTLFIFTVELGNKSSSEHLGPFTKAYLRDLSYCI